MIGPVARRSVFGRLRLMLAAVFLIGAATALAIALLFSRTAANEAYDRLLVSAALQIAETVSVVDNRVTATPPDAAFETLAQAKDDRVFYSVRDPSGRLITGNPGLPSSTPSGEFERPHLNEAKIAGTTVRTVTVGRYITTPNGGGWTTIVVAQTHQARSELASSLMLKIGALVVFVSSLGLVAALFAARLVLAPLVRIEGALADRDPNDVTPLDVESPSETQALVDAINLVMARFADRMSRLQAFVGLAAHQIRTPIAALMAQIELLEDETAETIQNARMLRIRYRLIELGRLTNQLLGHAMVVYRGETTPQGPVNLVEVARKALHDGVPQALDRDLTVQLRAPSVSVYVTGDEMMLREGLTNLVNNAAMHGAIHRLEMRVDLVGDEAIVLIFDDGPGIPPQNWDNAVKPFSAPRGDGPGAGLGLAIVQEIAIAHSTHLEFRHPPGGGFEAFLRLQARNSP